MALEKELETYREHWHELQQEIGKFVLIQGAEIVDTFDTYADALAQGYKAFGVETPFLVKMIEAQESVQLVTRLLESADAMTA